MQAASSRSVPSRLAPVARPISSAERGRCALSNASNTPSSQAEKTTWDVGAGGEEPRWLSSQSTSSSFMGFLCLFDFIF